MKTEMRNALMTVGFTALMSGMLVHGQIIKTEVAQIPFAFQVGAKVLPAGIYSATMTDSAGVIQLGERATGKSVIVAAFTPKAGAANESKLGFRCYSGRCFLSEIWFAGEANGHGIVRSAREKEIAVNAQAPQLVYLAAR